MISYKQFSDIIKEVYVRSGFINQIVGSDCKTLLLAANISNYHGRFINIKVDSSRDSIRLAVGPPHITDLKLVRQFVGYIPLTHSSIENWLKEITKTHEYKYYSVIKKLVEIGELSDSDFPSICEYQYNIAGNIETYLDIYIRMEEKRERQDEKLIGAIKLRVNSPSDIICSIHNSKKSVIETRRGDIDGIQEIILMSKAVIYNRLDV